MAEKDNCLRGIKAGFGFQNSETGTVMAAAFVKIFEQRMQQTETLHKQYCEVVKEIFMNVFQGVFPHAELQSFWLSVQQTLENKKDLENFNIEAAATEYALAAMKNIEHTESSVVHYPRNQQQQYFPQAAA